MKKKSKEVYFAYQNLKIWVLIFLLACSSQPNTSRDFNKYLSNFDSQISENEHYYVILSRYGCSSCSEIFLTDFMAKSQSSNQTKFTFIIGNNKQYAWPKNSISEFIFDKKELISRLNLNIADFTVLKTEKRIILAVWNFGASDSNKFQRFLNEELK